MNLLPTLQRWNRPAPRPDRGEHRAVNATRPPVNFSLSRQRRADPRVDMKRYQNSRFVISYRARPPLSDANTLRTMTVSGRKAVDTAREAMAHHNYRVESVRVKGLFG